ncbi:MAG: hypothetical protein EB059_04550 [Alphaproteobacteria bacterium]|nr:hypothetical protein [Alphaproteobacteria bacterium]
MHDFAIAETFQVKEASCHARIRHQKRKRLWNKKLPIKKSIPKRARQTRNHQAQNHQVPLDMKSLQPKPLICGVNSYRIFSIILTQ